MRWSAWRAKAPFKDSVVPKVLSVVDDALAGLGADPDPECWVVWGDDPASRYALLVPTPSGLVVVNVRVSVPGEGPRAGGKVVRWPRVQLGELAVEIQGGHRLVTFQVETHVLNGADAAGDAIAVFAQTIFAAIDGRPAPAPAKGRATPAKARLQGGRDRRRPAGSRPRRDLRPDRGGDLRHGRGHRRLGDLVGRGPIDVRRGEWTAVDRRRPGGGDGCQLARLGADHARAPAPRPARGRPSNARSWTASPSAIDAKARHASMEPSKPSDGSPRIVRSRSRPRPTPK